MTRKFPPSTGGMELFAHDLSGALSEKTSITLVKWGGHGRVKAVLLALPYLFVTSFGKLITNKIDVIHAQDGLLAPFAYVLSRLFGKPYVVVIHGLDITYTNPLFRAVVPWAVRRAAVVVCISQAAANAAKESGVPEGKLLVITLAVNDVLYGKSDRNELIKRLELSKDAQLLLTVGRLVKRKGVTWFIDAILPDLLKENPHIVYLVVGEGQERAAIEVAIAERKLEQHVRLLGRVGNDLYEAAYNGADVFVMPNINVPGDMEGFGLVLLEASTCELPVVATETEGIMDAVTDCENGVLVPVGDGKAFGQAVSRFLDSKDYAKRFGKQSRQFTSKPTNGTP